MGDTEEGTKQNEIRSRDGLRDTLYSFVHETGDISAMKIGARDRYCNQSKADRTKRKEM